MVGRNQWTDTKRDKKRREGEKEKGGLFVDTMLFEKHVAPAATQPLKLKSWSIRKCEVTTGFESGNTTTRLDLLKLVVWKLQSSVEKNKAKRTRGTKEEPIAKTLRKKNLRKPERNIGGNTLRLASLEPGDRAVTS